MANDDTWAVIQSERKALAADLEGLPEEAWDTKSLCHEWTVRDVLAHMTATAKLSGPKFMGKMIGSGFSLKRLQRKDIASHRGHSPDHTLANFKSIVDSTGRPPGPLDTMLGEVIVHSEDIRRPLGIAHIYPADAAAQAAAFYANSNLIMGGKNRVAGLTLAATDTDWKIGSGPVVEGPVLELVLAIAGRKAALAHLTGDGLDTLQSRV